MPLSFPSLSHGEIAFGFFNIESDMLLLNNYFFFADDFCRQISDLASSTPNQQISLHWDVYMLDQRDIGNLMGAINGIDLTGFIGKTYRLFPFPSEPHLFRQNPEGYKTRLIIRDAIENYAGLSRIAVTAGEAGQTITIGEYHFSRPAFHKLLNYVWAGGYPRWKDGIKPDYVQLMGEKAMQSPHQLFREITFVAHPTKAYFVV